MLIPLKGWLAGSLLAGFVYLLAAPLALPDEAQIAVKGAAVGLLAAGAYFAGQGRDQRHLALVLALGALGDMLLEIDFMVGAAAFAAGHVAAIFLYARNLRSEQPRSAWAVAVLLALFGLVMPLLILGPDSAAVVPLTLYSILLTIMAALAWLSRFSRALTGLGALLFVASDALIAVRMEGSSDAAFLGLAIWTLYHAGQILIFLGVMRAPSDARA